MDPNQLPTLDQEGVQESNHLHYQFRGGNGRESLCQLRIRWKEDTAVVCWTELPSNPGMSVTNASEALAAQVVAEYSLEPSKCLFIEHYPFERGISVDSWSIVSHNWNKLANGLWKAQQAAWEHLPEAEGRKLMSRFELAGRFQDGK